MKLSSSFFLLISIASAANAIAVPEGSESAHIQDLYKRRGGGGGGGGRGGSSGGSKSGGSKSGSSSSGNFKGGSSSGSTKSPGSSSSGSSSSGSSSGGKSSGSSSSSTGSSSSSSNAGGRTTTGSGVTPRFGGGKYYAGGATVPYRSGGRSPSGLLPLALVGGALFIWSSLWLAGAQMYTYPNSYRFQNYNSDPKDDEDLPVFCICQPEAVCGCDESDDYEWLDDIIGNDGLSALNESIIFIGEVNGTRGIYINGTLPNGTTAAEEIDDSSAAIHLSGIMSFIGFWPVVVAVAAAVLL